MPLILRGVAVAYIQASVPVAGLADGLPVAYRRNAVACFIAGSGYLLPPKLLLYG
jgi:hypothetical protein